MTGANRRRHPRYAIGEIVEIFHNGYTIELPARDISLSGLALESCGVGVFEAGDRCVVMFSDGTELEAQVVRATEEGVFLSFPDQAIEDVGYLLRGLRVGDKPNG